MYLTSEDEVANWKEVTNAEKEQIEAADAKWEPPSEELIKRWDAACVIVSGNVSQTEKVGGYDTKTGYFWLGSVKDLTSGNVLEALELIPLHREGNGSINLYNLVVCPPIHLVHAGNHSSLFDGCRSLRVCAIYCYYKERVAGTYYRAFTSCFNLKEIIGTIGSPANPTQMFENCKALETVKIKELNVSIDIRYSPLLTLESIKFLVENATNTTPITVTVHADVYAKLTDEGNEEWYAVNELARGKQISFATA